MRAVFRRSSLSGIVLDETLYPLLTNYMQSARELTAVMWGQELANVLTQCNVIVADVEDDHSRSKVQREVLSFGRKVKTALREVWRDAPTDVFDNAFVYLTYSRSTNSHTSLLVPKKKSYELTDSLKTLARYRTSRTLSIQY